MKKGLIFILCLYLSACATENISVRKQLNMPVQEQNTLNGFSQQTVKSLLGNPLAQRTEQPHCMWTYRQPDCTIFVYFGKNQKVRHSEARGQCTHFKEQLIQIVSNQQKGN